MYVGIYIHLHSHTLKYTHNIHIHSHTLKYTVYECFECIWMYLSVFECIWVYVSDVFEVCVVWICFDVVNKCVEVHTFPMVVSPRMTFSFQFLPLLMSEFLYNLLLKYTHNIHMQSNTLVRLNTLKTLTYTHIHWNTLYVNVMSVFECICMYFSVCECKCIWV
jgi:hypothetical protein